MSIDYTAHCAFPKGEAQRRIDDLRKTRPDWYPDMHDLTNASDFGRFDAEIAREFGIEVQCRFTYGNDSIRAPLREYPAMEIG